MKTLIRIALLVPLGLTSAAASAQQKFQIATIKPSPPNAERYTQSRGTKFATSGTTLEDLLKFAYNVHVSQITGGPDWVRTKKFDVVGDPEMEKRPSLDELKSMTADLLADRFHLVLRRETRELPVYALVAGKDGSKLKSPISDPSSILSGGLVPPGSLYVHGGTLSDFARYLERFAPPEVSRPIVDQSGIPGRFEFELHFTPDAAQSDQDSAALNSMAASPPGIFTALNDQLGLRLKATNAKVEVFDIISVSLPSPN
jgi:uncharacterized protein (TIGR03435 family)